MTQQFGPSEKTKALAQAVLNSLVSGEGFKQNEKNLLDNLKERNLPIDGFCCVERGCVEHGVVHIFLEEKDLWLKIDPEDGSCDYT